MKRLRTVLLALATASALVATLCLRPAARPTVEVWPLWHGGSQPGVAMGQHRIVVLPGRDHDTLRVDGRDCPLQGKLDAVPQDDSPDPAQRLVWKERLAGRARWTVDHVSGPWARDLSEVAFDLDGRPWYTATIDGQVCVLRDHQVWRRFDRLLGACPVSSGPSEFDDKATDAGPWYIGADARGQWLVIAGRCFGPYAQVGARDISSDRRHWAAYVQLGDESGSPGRWALLRDGGLYGSFDGLGLPPQRSTWGKGLDWPGPDAGPTIDNAGVTTFYTLEHGERRAWLGERSWPMPTRVAENLLFADAADDEGLILSWATGKGPANYELNGQPVGQSGGEGTGLHACEHRGWALVTGDPGALWLRCRLGRFGPFAEVEQASFSERGRLCWRSKRPGEGWRTWLDGQPLTVPPDSRSEFRGESLVTQYESPSGALVLVDGQPGPPIHRIFSLPIERGGHVGYLAEAGGQTVMVVDQQVRYRAEWDQLGDLRPRGDGRRWQATLTRPARVPWLDWLRPKRTADQTATTPDGRFTASVYGLAERWYLHHGRRTTRLSGPAHWLSISPDGRHTVCQVGHDRPWLVVDGRPLRQICLTNAQWDAAGAFHALSGQPGLSSTTHLTLRWPSRP